MKTLCGTLRDLASADEDIAGIVRRCVIAGACAARVEQRIEE